MHSNLTDNSTGIRTVADGIAALRWAPSVIFLPFFKVTHDAKTLVLILRQEPVARGYNDPATRRGQQSRPGARFSTNTSGALTWCWKTSSLCVKGEAEQETLTKR
jgi:hypothetical protein